MGFLKNLAMTGAATAATAAIGTLVTEPDQLWYKLQRKPSWQPPQIAFPIAWTALYASIAGASAQVLTKLEERQEDVESRAVRSTRKPGEPILEYGDESDAQATHKYDAADAATEALTYREEARDFKIALGVNLVLNAGWSALFWQSKNNWLSAAEAALLAGSSIDLARRAGKVDKAAGAALVPYALWTTFATALTTSIAAKND